MASTHGRSHEGDPFITGQQTGAEQYGDDSVGRVDFLLVLVERAHEMQHEFRTNISATVRLTISALTKEMLAVLDDDGIVLAPYILTLGDDPWLQVRNVEAVEAECYCLAQRDERRIVVCCNSSLQAEHFHGLVCISGTFGGPGDSIV